MRAEAKDLEISWHINIPGHPKNRRCIERFHITLSGHLRIYHVEKGLEPDVAMKKAVMAYNHSIHAATGFSSFEVLFGLREWGRDNTSTVVDEEMSERVVNNITALVK